MTPLLNHLKSISSITLAFLFFCFGLTVHAQENEDKAYIKTTTEGTTYEQIGWQDKVVYNPYTFTWFAWEKPIYQEKDFKKMEMVPVSEFDRPPVFTGNGKCLAVEDKFACSNNELQEYIAETFVTYPYPAKDLKQEGLEYVTFTLNEEGNFEGNLKVVSKDKPCKGCADAAVDMVANMEDMWFPAIRNGKTVKTELTIPVRFKLIDN